jgi:hypothetical protein
MYYYRLISILLS